MTLAVLSLFFGVALAFAAETNGSPREVRIALLRPYNVSGDTNIAHWQYALAALLEHHLNQEKQLNVAPQTSLNFAFRESNLKPGQALTPEEARKIGRIVEADWTLLGEYQVQEGRCTLKVEPISSLSSNRFERVTVVSSNWTDSSAQLVQQLLKRIGVAPGAKTNKEVRGRFTSSTHALELFARGYGAYLENQPLSTTEGFLQEALKEDPQFIADAQLLAIILWSENKLDEESEVLQRIFKADPESSSGRFLLGCIEIRKEDWLVAREEISKAIELDPTDSIYFYKLAEIDGVESRWKEALTNLQKAEALDPFDACTHAALGRAYVHVGNVPGALSELKKAKRYAVDDVGAEQVLAETFARLKHLPEAVQYYEKFLERAKAEGFPASLLKKYEDDLASYKVRLTPQYISATAPESYSPEQLKTALQKRLTPEEYARVINPFESTAEMRTWARQITAGANGDFEKAKKLYDTLIKHLNLCNEMGRRTARQTFEDWSSPKATIFCEGYTFLYVALAREAGLRANYVLVQKDFEGRFVAHACAAVFVGDKALLVDPTYYWFGVPHEKYELKSDPQAVGIYMAESGDIDQQRITIKFDPDEPMAHFNMAMDLARTRHLKEARDQLRDALKLDPTSWWAYYTEGAIAAYEDNWDEALQELEKCSSLDPEFPELHFLLGRVLLARGEYKEAREELRYYLDGSVHADLADDAREKIMIINKALASGGTSSSDK